MSTKKGTKFTKAHRLALSKAATARYAKKRGVKKGTKRGKYAKTFRGEPITLEQMDKAMGYKNKILKVTSIAHGLKVGDTVTIDIPKNYSPTPMVLCGQLEDAILLLENRISNVIAKINSLM